MASGVRSLLKDLTADFSVFGRGEVESGAADYLPLRFNHDPARYTVEQMGIAPVPVGHQDSPEAVADQRFAYVQHIVDKGFRIDTERAGKVHVMRAVPVYNWRYHDNVIGDEFSRSLAYLPAKEDIGIYRQVGAVVLNGGDGYEGHPVFSGNVTYLRPRHLAVKELFDHNSASPFILTRCMLTLHRLDVKIHNAAGFKDVFIHEARM